VLVVSLAGCPARPRLPVQAPLPARPVQAEGRAYAIDPGESLLTVLVFRGGLLASAGHNHVIASHSLSGAIHVPEDPLRATFEVRMPVEALTIDEPPLRRALQRDDFPPEVPAAARQGTRMNMLGDALLDSAHWPEIVLRSASLTPQAGSGNVLASVAASIRGQEHYLTVPVHYQMQADELIVSGEIPLKQTQLGLTPFSIMLGALTVQDEMHVQFHLLARASPDG
jgi:hypothetical protein